MLLVIHFSECMKLKNLKTYIITILKNILNCMQLKCSGRYYITYIPLVHKPHIFRKFPLILLLFVSIHFYLFVNSLSLNGLMWEICSFEFNNTITVCYQNICHFKFFYNKDSDTKGYFVMGRKKLKKKHKTIFFCGECKCGISL